MKKNFIAAIFAVFCVNVSAADQDITASAFLDSVTKQFWEMVASGNDPIIEGVTGNGGRPSDSKKPQTRGVTGNGG